ncbi:MAG: TetR/AcrR family transcriptional regulator, partial [Bacteroidota bacterium]|nr:TetR/AcrR family transcriptional regulator [Bacteroidota bacterium]
MAPKTKEQYNEIRETTKARIKNEALKLFAENGYHSSSISIIAKKANISKGLMYNYFDNKEDLLKQIIFSGFAEIIHPDLLSENEPITNETFNNL